MPIAATAMAHRTLGSEAANLIMHDLAGWLMMPLALAMLWLEMKYLDYLLVEEEPPRPMALTFERSALALPHKV